MSAYDEIEKIIFSFGVEAATKGGQEACDRVEYGHRFHFEDADALRYLMENAIKLSQSSMDRLKGNIDAVIEAGVRDGKPLREVTKEVQAVFENFKGWEAERVARTEVARATNAGAITGYKEMGIGVAEVVANAGACPKCAALNGELYPTDQAMRVLPRHPNCYCFWIPRPDITNPNVKDWRSFGEISNEVIRGLGLTTAFNRVSAGPDGIKHISEKSEFHPNSVEKARVVVESAEMGIVQKNGVLCLIMDHPDGGWYFVPIKHTDDYGYIIKTAFHIGQNRKNWFYKNLDEAEKRYGI